MYFCDILFQRFASFADHLVLNMYLFEIIQYE